MPDTICPKHVCLHPLLLVCIPRRRGTVHRYTRYTLLAWLGRAIVYTHVRRAGVRGNGCLARVLVYATFGSARCVLGAETVLLGHLLLGFSAGSLTAAGRVGLVRCLV